MTIADDARKFWSASQFWRRAPDRDRSIAVKIINDLSTSHRPSIARRALALLEKMQNEPANHD